MLKASLSVEHEPSYLIRSVHIFGALADMALRRGRLEEAEVIWRRALEAIRSQESWGRVPIPVSGWVCVRLAEIHYERDQIAEAASLLQRGLELAQLGGEPRSLIAGHLLAARIGLSQHDLAQTEVHLEMARPVVEQTQFAEWAARFERTRLELWIAQDKLRSIDQWLQQRLASPADPLRLDPDLADLTLARAQIVLGGEVNLTRAVTTLQRIAGEASRQGRLAIQIEALVLEALSLHARRDATGSFISLERALRYGNSHGYVRLFADLGQPMWFLLQEARARDVMPEYIGRILAACPASPAGSAGPEIVLTEPLSAREHQVLELLAAGLTNAEMGDRLFISPETVKKHTSSIYAKLAVRRRTEAVARARQLGLLERPS